MSVLIVLVALALLVVGFLMLRRKLQRDIDESSDEDFTNGEYLVDPHCGDPCCCNITEADGCEVKMGGGCPCEENLDDASDRSVKPLDTATASFDIFPLNSNGTLIVSCSEKRPASWGPVPDFIGTLKFERIVFVSLADGNYTYAVMSDEAHREWPLEMTSFCKSLKDMRDGKIAGVWRAFTYELDFSALEKI